MLKLFSDRPTSSWRLLRDAAASGHRSPDLAYRPDIDGLRAVAVLLVVLNHADVALMSGGFVGVDVFFVISGFLITALIAAQRRRGTFSFRDFYLRRAKRLLPALYIVMLVTLVAGYRLLTPSDYAQLAQSALWAVGLASNLFFWRNTGGYFSSDASAFPLLHVWSLSVEEQFYLLWPAALLLLLRLPRGGLRLPLVGVLAALSFAWAQYGVAQGWVGAYFLLPARAGEFLAGALVFLLWDRGWRASRPVAEILSLLGAGLVVGSAVLLDARSPFPGVAALAPCLGAALVIAAPRFGPSLVTRALSTPPFVAVGLISYSVYLWHWPIVSYLRLSRVAFTPLVTAGIVAASLALGWASWRLIERGLRVQLDRRRAAAWAATGLASLLVVAAPLYIHRRQGMPERFPYALLTQAELTAERNRYWREMPAPAVNLKAGSAITQLLIVGNSHAYDLAYALRENGYPGAIKIIETRHECFNFGHDAILPENAAACAERRGAVLTNPDLPKADVVYLHDHWGSEDMAGLADMIGLIRRRTDAPIYVFGPKMVFTDDVLAISKRAQGERRVTAAAINAYAARFQDADRGPRDARLKAFFASRDLPDVHYVSSLDVQCGAKMACDILSPDGTYLYFDAGHFTLEGARRFGRTLKREHPEVFRGAKTTALRPPPGSSPGRSPGPPREPAGG